MCWIWNKTHLIEQPWINIKLKKNLKKNKKQNISWLLVSLIACQPFLSYSLLKSAFFGKQWYYLPNPPLGQDMTQGQFLSGV